MLWEHKTSKPVHSAAVDRFAKAKDRDTRIAEEQARLRQASDDKSARLRSLRLAKEAADRIAAEELSAAKKAQASYKSRPSRRAGAARVGLVAALETPKPSAKST